MPCGVFIVIVSFPNHLCFHSMLKSDDLARCNLFIGSNIWTKSRGLALCSHKCVLQVMLDGAFLVFYF